MYSLIADSALGACSVPPMMSHLVLQASPEALHGGIIVAVPLARHGCPHAELRAELAAAVGAVLAVAIRVQDQAWRGPFPAYLPPQRLRRQLLRHPWAHRIAHHFTREDVLDASKIKPSFFRRDIGDIPDPSFVWPRRCKTLLQQVRRHWERVIRIRRGPKPPLLLSPQWPRAFVEVIG